MEQLELNKEDATILLEYLKRPKKNYPKKIKKSFSIKAFIPKYIDGNELTIMFLINLFGSNPYKKEPCFYNQDWYIRETFANTPPRNETLIYIDSKIPKENRGDQPSSTITKGLPTALELTYIFFMIYLKYNFILWQNDYVWTSDKDQEGDQIYVGRYCDPQKLVKNGFSIHRHLSIKSNYGFIEKK